MSRSFLCWGVLVGQVRTAFTEAGFAVEDKAMGAMFAVTNDPERFATDGVDAEKRPNITGDTVMK